MQQGGYNVSIRGKLLTIVLLLFAFIIVVVGFNLSTYNQLKGDAPNINLTGSQRMRTFKIAFYTTRYVATGNSDYKDLVVTEINQYEKIIAGLFQGNQELNLSAVTDEKALMILNEAKILWESYKEHVMAIINDPSAGKLDVLDTLSLELAGKFDELTFKLDHFSQLNIKTATMISYIALSLAVILVFLALRLVVNIIRSLEDLNKAMNDIASGEADLTKRLSVKGNDELARLAQNFNAFTNQLRVLIAETKESSSHLAISSNELSLATEQSNKAMEEVASNSGLMISAVEELKSTTDDTYIKLERTVEKIIENVGRIVQAAESSLKSKEIALQGGEASQEASNIMKEIATAIEDNTEVLLDLRSKANKISEFVKVINGIADQTNLLALNATIEAARAGEHGRGFAVVAEEVRKLADHSSQQAAEIRELVNTIQTKTEQATVSMNRAAIKAGDGLNQVNLTKDRIQEVVEAVVGIANNSKEMERASQEQKSLAEDMQEGMLLLTELTNKVTSNIQEIGAAVEEQASTFEEIGATTEELSAMAQSLEALVSRFKA